MSSAILRSSFAASVRTTFSKSQRNTINTKRSVMTKAVRRRRRRRRFLFFSYVSRQNDRLRFFSFSSFSSFCFRVNARENQLTSQKLSCYTHTRTLTRDIFTFITQVTITEGVGTLLFDVVEKFRSFLFLFFFPVFPGVSVMRYFSFRSLSLSLSLLLLLRILRLSIISSIETLLNSTKCKLFVHSFIHRIRHGRSRMAHEMVPGRRQGIFSRRPKSVGKATRDGEGSQRRQERPKSRLRWMHGL